MHTVSWCVAEKNIIGTVLVGQGRGEQARECERDHLRLRGVNIILHVGERLDELEVIIPVLGRNTLLACVHNVRID
jgi:hypothetical protein